MRSQFIQRLPEDKKNLGEISRRDGSHILRITTHLSCLEGVLLLQRFGTLHLHSGDPLWQQAGEPFREVFQRGKGLPLDHHEICILEQTHKENIGLVTVCMHTALCLG